MNGQNIEASYQANTDDKGRPQEVELDQREFRDALGFFPTGVAVITTLDQANRPTGLTCNSFSSVSLDPPLVLWSLRKASSSIDIFRQTKAFVINVLAGDQRDLSSHFAKSDIANKFDSMTYQKGYAGMPLINDCVARFQCSAFQQHDAGDHVIFIGRVERVERVREDDPLLFCKGAYMMVTQSLRELAVKGQIGPAKLLEARKLLYMGMARLACANGTDEDFNAIEVTLEEMRSHIAAGDMLQRAKLAIQFFDQIASAAHNEIVAVVAQSLTTLLQLDVNTCLKSDGMDTLYRPELDPIRWKILIALRNRDETAAENGVTSYINCVSLSKLGERLRA